MASSPRDFVRESASPCEVSLGETARQRFEPNRAVTVLVRYKSHKFPPRANIAPCLCADGFVRGAHQQKKIGTHKECLSFFGDPYGNRTHVTAVKGPCLNRLTNGPRFGSGCRI